MHTTHIIPKGRAYLSGLEHLMVTQHNKPHVALTQPKGTAFELNWRFQALSSSSPLCPIPAPSQVSDVDTFSDVSSGTGIAFLVSPKWKAWRLLPNWQSDGRNIAWAKAIAFELMASAVMEEHGQHKTYKLYCDNRTVIKGWHNSRSRNRHVTPLYLSSVHTLLTCTILSVLCPLTIYVYYQPVYLHYQTHFGLSHYLDT